ncbi:Crp/Fnr family transcriptional regulator [Epilithonimonas sp.]|uniref:Crp/Fnr family transcriptional regulator n=1 Tax=Epilithonimonas sp. TaxID=2894511 RepID=UPI00289A166B|nr:Crp/Fnr family transcriptional regulator [Epilithonimonas sp.]
MLDRLIKESEDAITQNYSEGDIIFSGGDKPVFYYHIIKGEVKLQNKDGASRELTQDVLYEGKGIAEFGLFINEFYPVTAVAVRDCILIKLPKASFLSLLNKYPEIRLELLKSMSNSIYYKYLMGDIYFVQNAENKIIMLLDYLKRQQPNQFKYSYKIALTRKEISNLTGLRVETVIRSIKKMEKQGILKIIDRKIFY